MEIRVLGPLQVLGDEGERLDLGGPKPRALTCILAALSPRPISREFLLNALWKQPPPSAKRTLAAYLSRLHKVLGDALTIDGDRVWLDGAHLDSHRFEDQLSEASGSRELLAALELWRGNALQEGEDISCCQAEAARLEDLRLVTLERYMRSARGDPLHEQRAIGLLESGVERHPLRESLWASLIDGLWHTGRTAEALSAYRRVRDLLADHLGLDPDPRLQALERSIILGTQPMASDLLDLPAPRDRFVGRGDDIHHAIGLLEEHRAVTFLGPAGVGKTRLAVEVSRIVAPRMKHGAVFVPLAAANNGSFLPILTSKLSPSASEGEDPVAALIEGMRGRERLVILDNAEHLTAEVASICDRLLDECPHLRLIVTSREPLMIPGEVVARIDPLTEDADELVRVRTAAAGAILGNPQIKLIAKLSGGLPLAIELAASTLTSSSFAEVVEGLERANLEGRGRSLTPHQRSLDSVMAWSFDMLGSDARRVFIEGAFWPAGVPSEAPIPGLQRERRVLHERSLVMEAGSRMTYLEPMRAWALQKAADGPRNEALDRLASWVIGAVGTAMSSFEDGEEAPVLQWFDDESANLWAAADRLAATDPVSALALAVDWSTHWNARGQRRQGLARLRTAIGACKPGPDLAARAHVAAILLALASDREVLQHHLVAIADLEGRVSEPVELQIQLALAQADTSLGRFRAAARRTTEAERLAERLGRVADVSGASYLRGAACAALGDLAGAAAAYERSRLAAMAARRHTRKVGALIGLASLARTEGRWVDAEALLDEAEELSATSGLAAPLAAVLGSRAQLFAARGEIHAAMERYEFALAASRTAEDSTIEAATLVNLAILMRRSGQEGAEQIANRALDISQRIGADHLITAAKALFAVPSGS